MALNVWLREEDLPKNKKFIDCNDAYFINNLSRLQIDDKVKHIVKTIDGATFINKNTLYSKYGNVMDIKYV